MPWGIAANYADEGKFFEATAPWPVPGEKTGPAPLAHIGPIVEQAERRWGSAAGSVRILNPGDRSAQVIVSSAPDAGMSISLRSLTRSGERMVGKQCVSTCSSWWSPYHSKKTKKPL